MCVREELPPYWFCGLCCGESRSPFVLGVSGGQLQFPGFIVPAECLKAAGSVMKGEGRCALCVEMRVW